MSDRVLSLSVQDKENIGVLVRKTEVNTSPTPKRPLTTVTMIASHCSYNKYSVQEFISPLKKRKTARLLHYQSSPPTSPLPSYSQEATFKQELIEEEIRLQTMRDKDTFTAAKLLMHVLPPTTFVVSELPQAGHDTEESGEEELDDADESDGESEEEEVKPVVRRLLKPAKASTNKIYEPSKSTTCHQCKQKTTDRKTCCSRCTNTTNSNIRGCFCGSCLRNRYGEDIDHVLSTPGWVCPICRNVCNCSSCRRKACKNPVSITTREALKSDHLSVYHMLIEKRKHNSSIDV
ncbi:cell division cycle-associated 7-like protein [Acrasis kona]|uniref:Cell division cycle-associated 7-like protein n=1 Tax=Acrasis kona TaxID=1008807 RepID=A0AAW2ZF86_9EUKA